MLLSSCEKGIDEISVDSVVYLPQSGLSEHVPLLGESVYRLGVYKSGVNQEHAVVSVALGLDAAAFTEFSVSNPGYELLPESYYSLPAGEVTMDRGSERGDYLIHLKRIDENFINKNYVLPIAIREVTPGAQINEEKKRVLLHLKRFRNNYETKYKAFGTVTGPGESERTIDQARESLSVSGNIIRVPGTETAMSLHLAVSGTQVTVTAAPGSEGFDIRPDPDHNSVYEGQFDETYQVSKGTFRLFYTYLLNGVRVKAHLTLSFTM